MFWNMVPFGTDTWGALSRAGPSARYYTPSEDLVFVQHVLWMGGLEITQHEAHGVTQLLRVSVFILLFFVLFFIRTPAHLNMYTD